MSLAVYTDIFEVDNLWIYYYFKLSLGFPFQVWCSAMKKKNKKKIY